MPKRSLINSSTELNDTTCAVVIYAKNHHALIGLEIFKNNRHELFLMDFLPGEPTGIDCFNIKENEVLPGHVRIRVQDLNGKTMNQLRQELGLKEGVFVNYRTTTCTNIQAASLITSTRASQINPPHFQVAGNKRPGAVGHNCISWAESQLTAAGIQVAVDLLTSLATSSNNSSDPFVVHPDKHTLRIDICTIS